MLFVSLLLLECILPGLFQVHSAVEEMDGLDDVENSMLYYNQAVILYHLRQYTEAISVGEKLYQFIEPFGMSSLSCKFLYCFYLDDLNLSYMLAFKGGERMGEIHNSVECLPCECEGLHSVPSPHENSWACGHGCNPWGGHRRVC